MIEVEPGRPLVRPVMVCAFTGWNDAGNAASGLIELLLDEWNSTLIGQVDPEDYYDFQVNRPSVSTDSRGMRVLKWPTTEIHLARPPGAGFDVVLVLGPEPNLRWNRFVTELIDMADDLGVETVVTLGALLAETPHTRAFPVTGSATEPDLADRLSVEAPSYEGPTGIVGVLQDMCARLDLPAVSLWCAIPHYLPQPPSPRGTLALLGHLEDALEISLPAADLLEDARAWDRGVADLTEDDEDMREYIEALEEAADAAELPDASGEAIARDFERYLKRRDIS